MHSLTSTPIVSLITPKSILANEKQHNITFIIGKLIPNRFFPVNNHWQKWIRN